jgi:hypothetical protein
LQLRFNSGTLLSGFGARMPSGAIERPMGCLRRVEATLINPDNPKPLVAAPTSRERIAFAAEIDSGQDLG